MRLRTVPRSTILAVLLLALAVLSVTALMGQAGAASIRGLDGGSLTVDELGRGDTILVFWSSWSPRCRDIVEQVNPIFSKWNDRARVATVNFQEEPAAIRDFLTGKQLRAPVFVDDRGAFSRKHAVTDLPGLVIYRDGKVAYQGKLPREADQLIQRYLG